MKRLPRKLVDERIVVTFNFTRRLGEGVTLSAPVVTATVVSGVDDSPSAVISGAPTVLGAKVLQLTVSGIAAVDYRLQCQVDTSDGQRFVLAARLPVRNA